MAAQTSSRDAFGKGRAKLSTTGRLTEFHAPLDFASRLDEFASHLPSAKMAYCRMRSRKMPNWHYWKEANQIANGPVPPPGKRRFLAGR
jgi:hypothetical protein